MVGLLYSLICFGVGWQRCLSLELRQCEGRTAKIGRGCFPTSFVSETYYEAVMRYYINTRNGLRIIELDEVVYLKADGNYTDFHYADGKVKTELSCLSAFESKISSLYITENTVSPFYRMGRSYLINTSHVSAINFQSLVVSFRQDNVKAISSTKNILKELRDHLIKIYNVME